MNAQRHFESELSALTRILLSKGRFNDPLDAVTVAEAILDECALRAAARFGGRLENSPGTSPETQPDASGKLEVKHYG
jgi:hypothetical protein